MDTKSCPIDVTENFQCLGNLKLSIRDDGTTMLLCLAPSRYLTASNRWAKVRLSTCPVRENNVMPQKLEKLTELHKNTDDRC